jgi:SAM-dependent methyltransferase
VADKADLTMFRELADLPWANLVLGATPLPALPPESVQRNWCGNSGVALALQSADFYRLLKQSYARHAVKSFAESMILDFGCGWGRLTRLFAKDLPPSQIFGCDPDGNILEWCRDVPGTFRQSETRPRRLPFEKRFDLAFAFSVFTHLGPNTHETALNALHASLQTEGLLIATIRPRAFLEIRAADLATLPVDATDRLLAAYDQGKYVYHPYNLPPVEGEVPYGEAIIPLAHIEQHWTDRFEILEQASSESDPYQISLVMRRK